MVSKSKRIVALLLTAMMATTVLVGCGGDEEESKSGNPPAVNSTATDVSNGGEESNDSVSSEGPTVEAIKNAIAKEAKEKGDKPINIRVWCASDDLNFEKSLVNEFKKTYEDDRYSFKISVITKGEDEAGSALVQAPNKGASVFSFPDDQLSTLNENGAISAVAPMYRESVKATNTDDAIKVSSIGDKLYAFPKTSDNGFFLYYDKRVFGEDDIKDFDTMIQKASENGKNVYMNLSNAWYNAGFFFAAGCTIKYQNGTQTATLDTAEGLAAAKSMCELAKHEGKGFIGSPGGLNDNAYVTQFFTDDGGTLCAAVIGTWMGPSIKRNIGEENVGAAKLPSVKMNGQDTQLHSFGGYKLIGVNVYAEYPVASQALAYFLSSGESQLKRYNTRGLIPTNIKATENEKVKNDPAFKAIADQKPYAHAQGKSVSSKYWAAKVDAFGGDIVNAKGNLDDATLQAKLKGCVENMK